MPSCPPALSLLLLALATAAAKPMNITSSWVLPEDGFPVFYRYFRDRISWYEADAVCQFHHGNLVTVDTTAQYDAVRAYLKELDISNNVWIGLIKSNPNADFIWTREYRGLTGEGYWVRPPEGGSVAGSPLCAAADPASDYRWNALGCGGPDIASFICELAVPQWAVGPNGCMVRALPALTAVYLPDSAAIQLTTDCGLGGIKRVVCNKDTKHGKILKVLTCADNSQISVTTTARVENISKTNNSIFSSNKAMDLTVDNNTEILYQYNTYTDEQYSPESIRTSSVKKSGPIKNRNIRKPAPAISDSNEIKSPSNSNIITSDYKFIMMSHNNLQSNEIPKIMSTDDFTSDAETEAQRNQHHDHLKNVHNEIANTGNFETIYTQPTDNFVPPLVIAKSKLNTDINVMTTEEKYSQIRKEYSKLDDRSFGKSGIVAISYKSPINISESDQAATEITFTAKNTEDDQNAIGISKVPLSKGKLSKKFKKEMHKQIKIKARPINNYKNIGLLTSHTRLTSVAPLLQNTTQSYAKDDHNVEIKVLLSEPNEKNTTHDNETRFAWLDPHMDTTNTNEITNSTITEQSIKSNTVEIQATVSDPSYESTDRGQHLEAVTLNCSNCSYLEVPTTQRFDFENQDLLIKASLEDLTEINNNASNLYQATTLYIEENTTNIQQIDFENKTGLFDENTRIAIEKRHTTPRSLLLSGAEESIPSRPMRRRKPIANEHFKFNPLRILG